MIWYTYDNNDIVTASCVTDNSALVLKSASTSNLIFNIAVSDNRPFFTSSRSHDMSCFPPEDSDCVIPKPIYSLVVAVLFRPESHPVEHRFNYRPTSLSRPKNMSHAGRGMRLPPSQNYLFKFLKVTYRLWWSYMKTTLWSVYNWNQSQYRNIPGRQV